MKNLLLLLFAAPILFSCESDNGDETGATSSSQNDPAKTDEKPVHPQDTVNTFLPEVPFLIQGTIKGGAGQTIVLDRLGTGSVRPLFTQTVSADNQFGFDLYVREPQLMRLRFADKSEVFFIASPNDTIQLTLDRSNLDTIINVVGGPETLQLDEMWDILRRHNETQIILQDSLDKLKTSQQKAAWLQKMPVLSKAVEMKKSEELARLIRKVDTSFVALLAAAYIDPAENIELMEEVASRMKRYSYSEFYKPLQERVEVYGPLSIGRTAPEIRAPSPEGPDVTLSSLRGKWVLVDFWASWCGPCRKENPKVKALYDQYKSKGFEILGVSLDDNRDQWVKAIADDGVDWIHASDLQGYGSAPALLYVVNAIPYTVLVNPEGKIVAKGLRGASLEAKLAEVLP